MRLHPEPRLPAPVFHFNPGKTQVLVAHGGAVLLPVVSHHVQEQQPASRRKGSRCLCEDALRLPYVVQHQHAHRRIHLSIL